MPELQLPYRSEKATQGFSIVLGLSTSLFKVFPEHVVWNNIEFIKKKEFHTTLVHVHDTVQEEKVVSLFSRFVAEKSINVLSFSGELRSAMKENRQTLLVLCAVSNLAEFFTDMHVSLGLDIPVQPTHVTLYTLPNGRGIAVDSEEEMRQLPLVSLLGCNAPRLAAGLHEIISVEADALPRKTPRWSPP